MSLSDDRLRREVRVLRAYRLAATALLGVATLAAFQRAAAPARFTELDVERLNVRAAGGAVRRARLAGGAAAARGAGLLRPPRPARGGGARGHGRVPVAVNDSARHHVFDTGANLSTLMRSEARALGVRVVPAGLDVGSSTDRRVTADLGVADRLVVGGVHYRLVVFLVLDDNLLTFGDFRIPGIVGFPVIEAMGEVRLGRDVLDAFPGSVLNFRDMAFVLR